MDRADIEDLFHGLGPVTIRRMFGGKGIYHHGVIFAIELRGEMMLKADAESAPQFEEAGAKQWAYEGKTGKPVLMPYWSIPEEALDDPDEIARWARLAYEAGVRSASR